MTSTHYGYGERAVLRLLCLHQGPAHRQTLWFVAHLTGDFFAIIRGTSCAIIPRSCHEGRRQAIKRLPLTRADDLRSSAPEVGALLLSTCPPGESRTECATASVPVGFAKAFQIAAARSLCACKEPAIRRSPKRIATPTTCPTTSASCGCLRMRAGTGDNGCGCSTMQSRLIWHQQHVKPSRVSTK